MTTISEDANAYDIRREALRRVREQAEAAKEIQGEVAYFYSARAKLMEAAIRKEIADKQKEKAKDLANYREEFKNENKVDYNPPVEGEDKPVGSIPQTSFLMTPTTI